MKLLLEIEIRFEQNGFQFAFLFQSFACLHSSIDDFVVSHSDIHAHSIQAYRRGQRLSNKKLLLNCFFFNVCDVRVHRSHVTTATTTQDHCITSSQRESIRNCIAYIVAYYLYANVFPFAYISERSPKPAILHSVQFATV